MWKSLFTPRLTTGIIVAFPILMGIGLGCSHPPPNGPSEIFRVTFVFPTSGPADSATELNIYGSGFAPGATVTVGGAATNVEVVSSGLIRVMTPIHPEGTVDVIVTNPGGQATSVNRAYTYFGFEVIDMSPRRGLPGDVLRVAGTGFKADAVLTIGGVEVRVIQPTGSILTALAPALPPGLVEVSVTNPDGQRRTVAQGFTFEAVAISASPASVAAGSPLSVTWGTPSSRSPDDWVGLFRVGDANANAVWSQYTGGATRNTLTIPAPNQPGSYEFRYFADDGLIDAARSGVVNVTGLGEGGR